MNAPQPPATSSFTPSRETAVWLASLPIPPGAKGTPRPQSIEQWQLVEQFRLLCTTITALASWERQRLEIEQKQWDTKAASLAPITAQLSLNPHHQHHQPTQFPSQPVTHHHNHQQNHNQACTNPDHHHHHHHSPHQHQHHNQHNHHHHHHHPASTDPHHASLDLNLHHALVPANGHSHLPPVPPVGAISAATYDSIPSLYASIAELESCVLRLSRETAEAQGLQRQLAAQLENRPVPTTVDDATLPEDRAAIQKVLKAASLLDRKADEYRNRLAALKAQIQRQLPAEFGAPGSGPALAGQGVVPESRQVEWTQNGHVQADQVGGKLTEIEEIPVEMPKVPKGKGLKKATVRRMRDKLLGGGGH